MVHLAPPETPSSTPDTGAGRLRVPQNPATEGDAPPYKKTRFGYCTDLGTDLGPIVGTTESRRSVVNGVTVRKRVSFEVQKAGKSVGGSGPF